MLMRVMVVDDAPDIRRLLRIVLTANGFTVVEASDGVDALRRLDEGESPDLILLDIQMPVMDGFETLRRIRASQAAGRVPVVMCSVKSSEADVALATELGCHAYLTKPFDLDEVVNTARQHALAS